MEDKFGWIVLFCVIMFALVFFFSPRLAGFVSEFNIKTVETTTSTIALEKTYDTLTEQYCPRELMRFLGKDREVEFNENKSEAQIVTQNVNYYCQASHDEESNEIMIKVEREQTACSGSGEGCGGIGIRTPLIDYKISPD